MVKYYCLAYGRLSRMENQNIKPKILLVLTRPPYPAVDGTRERILGELKLLRADFQVDLLIIGQEKIDQESYNFLLSIGIHKIINFKLIKITCYLRSIVALFKKQPLQSNYFFNKQANNWLKNNFQKYQTIIFHTIRFGEYLKSLKSHKNNHNIKLLLYFNDAISLNYQGARKKAKGIWKLIYSLEENRVKNYELDMLNIADGFSIISQRDKNYLEKNWQKKYGEKIMPSIKIVRNSLDENLLQYNYQPQTENLVFIGNLLYPPNKQGLEFFCQKIWPIIIQAKPQSKLIIIGKNGQKYFNHYPNIQALGFMEKPYDLITKQALFISPADFGAGVPTKTLLAMALGMPVISTYNNAAGINDIKNDENICLIDYNNIELSAKKIISALENKNYCQHIGRQGKKLIIDYYQQSKNYLELKDFILNK